MSSQVHLDETAIRGEDDLLGYLAAGFKPSDQWVIGTEHEKFGWWSARKTAPDYFDSCGIGPLLERLTDFGWSPKSEAGHIVALSKGGATVTLEPGAS